MTQQLYSWAFIAAKWKLVFSQKLVHECSLELYLRQPRTGISLDVPQQVNGQINCETSILWSTTQSRKGRNCWDPWQLGWISRELYWVQKASPKRMHSIWFHLCNFLNDKTDDRVRDLGLSGPGRRWIWFKGAAQWGSLWCWNISVSLLQQWIYGPMQVIIQNLPNIHAYTQMSSRNTREIWIRSVDSSHVNTIP